MIAYDNVKHKRFWDDKQRDGEYGGYSNILEDFPLPSSVFERMIPPNFINSERTLLEIGFGSGNWLKYMSPKVKKIHGVDISPEAERIAKENLTGYDNISLHITDGDNLNMFPANTFDFIYSYWVFQHLPRSVMLAYLKEMKRLLKIGGLALFQVIGYLESTPGKTKEAVLNIIESEKKNSNDIDIDIALTQTNDIGTSGTPEIQIGYSYDSLNESVGKSGLHLIKVDRVVMHNNDPWNFPFYVDLWSLCERRY